MSFAEIAKAHSNGYKACLHNIKPIIAPFVEALYNDWMLRLPSEADDVLSTGLGDVKVRDIIRLKELLDRGEAADE